MPSPQGPSFPSLSWLCCKLAALAQAALVLHALPQLLLRPRWPALVAALGGAARANVLGMPLLHALVLVVGNTFFAALYALRLPAVERLRSAGAGAGAGASPWHFSAEASAAQRAAFWSRVPWAVGSTLLNVLLTVPLAAGNYALAVRLGHSASPESFPSTPVLLAQLLAFTVAEDALFYAGHRLLHSSQLLYVNVHKFHHSWVQTSSIAAEATHPLEFIICNVVPFAAGPLLLGAHLATLYTWTIWRVLETIAHHSGYELPTSMFTLLPFQGDARAHDLHHARGGGIAPSSGNYASFFTHFDVLCGTVLRDGEGEGEARKSA